MQNQAQKENQLPKWLEKQQRQSWQIEILIASGVLFFLIKLPDFFKE